MSVSPPQRWAAVRASCGCGTTKATIGSAESATHKRRACAHFKTTDSSFPRGGWFLVDVQPRFPSATASPLACSGFHLSLSCLSHCQLFIIPAYIHTYIQSNLYMDSKKHEKDTLYNISHFFSLAIFLHLLMTHSRSNFPSASFDGDLPHLTLRKLGIKCFVFWIFHRFSSFSGLLGESRRREDDIDDIIH